MKKWIIDRLSEKSTWLGIAGLISATGLSFAPELADSIVTLGVALGSLLAIIFQEKAK